MQPSNDAETSPVAVATRRVSPPTAHIPSHLGPTLKIKGEIVGDEDLKIDGSVLGPISLGRHRLTVGITGDIQGGIDSQEIMLYGKVAGNLRAPDRIEIKKDASVVGDLTTGRITIDDGAYFKGTVQIDRVFDFYSEPKAATVAPMPHDVE